MRLRMFCDRNDSRAISCRMACRLNLLFLLLILVSCAKDKDVPACQQDHIQINSNVSIVAEDTAHHISKMIIGDLKEPLIEILIAFTHKPFEDLSEMVEGIQFLWLPCQEGLYDLSDTNQLGRDFTFYGHRVDRDQAGYVHELMDDRDNYLEIISLDTLDHRIHARFEAHFRRTYEGTWTYDFPEEVHFTDCEFCLEYEEQ